MKDAKKSPKAFRPDDPNLVVEDTRSEVRMAQPLDEDALPVPRQEPPAPKRGLRWGTLFLSAIGGLVTLAAGVWLHDLVMGLLAREAWIGWLATGLVILAGIAGGVLAITEALALARLSRLGTLSHDATLALDQSDKPGAQTVIEGLERLYSGRQDMAWARGRFADHSGDIMDARELLTLAERELIAPLDRQAHDAVAQAAKRVSVLTAVSPAAFLDMLLVGVANLRMLRQIATIYGARPATLGLMKLARMVVSHIVVTGGIAIGDDMLQQMLGQKLTAKISARLGEGVFNGALTARIGLAALNVCRPLPHIDTGPPRFRDLASRVLGLAKDTGKT